MTAEPDSAIEMQQQEQASLSCVIDSPDLLRVRILPAQFARALGVSKQSVSRWVRDGWVVLGADGRLDPAVAIGQLLRRCDPGRLRARWLRQAVSEVQELRDNLVRAEDRAVTAEAALLDALGQLAYWKKWATDGDRSFEILLDLIVEHADRLRAAPADDWEAILDGLRDDAIIAADPAGYAECAEDELGDFIDAVEAPRDLSTPEGGGAE